MAKKVAKKPAPSRSKKSALKVEAKASVQKKPEAKKQTLQDIEAKLWQAADKLRSNMDAAEYKHVVLGLIFLKYVSDSFDEFREILKTQFTDPKHPNYFKGGTEKQIEKCRHPDTLSRFPTPGATAESAMGIQPAPHTR